MPPTAVVSDSDRLVRALAPEGAEVPAAFRTFQALATQSAPDFTEHSVTFGGALEPFRITHYFDLAATQQERTRELGERFLALAAALGFPVPQALPSILRTVLPGSDRVAQLVLGVDARARADATRIKLYVLLAGESGALVERIRLALGVPLLPGLDPAKAFLLGLDLDRGGLSDLKLYLRLERARAARIARNAREVRALIEGARSVVLQQCLLHGARRQIHFHADSAVPYLGWLTQRAREDAGAAAVLEHLRLLESRLEGRRLAPWIVGLPHRDERLVLGSGNVYFHVGFDGTPTARASER